MIITFGNPVLLSCPEYFRGEGREGNACAFTYNKKMKVFLEKTASGLAISRVYGVAGLLIPKFLNSVSKLSMIVAGSPRGVGSQQPRGGGSATFTHKGMMPAFAADAWPA